MAATTERRGVSAAHDHARRSTRFDAALRLARSAWPAWLVAFSLNGFFVYLGALDVLGTEPRTPITATYYTGLAALLAVAVWTKRQTLLERLRRADRTLWVFVAATVLLAGWFVLNVALLAGHSLAWRLAVLLVIWSLPTALLAASLAPGELRHLVHGIVALAIVFAAIELPVALLQSEESYRFTPVAPVDPISAALVTALGAALLLTLAPASRLTLALLLLTFTALVASTVLPGSRGPLLALVFATVVIAAARRSPMTLLAIPCLVVGVAAGTQLSQRIGSYSHLSSDLPELVRGRAQEPADEGPSTEPPPISTVAIRRQWLAKAIDAVPERPWFGHGVGMLVDDTPEARRMGVYGQRIYPHNTLVEAAFSLGLVGLVLFLVVLGAGARALLWLVRRRRDTATILVLALGAFAFVHTNVSGEIGADAVLWTALALSLALYLDGRRHETAARETESGAPPGLRESPLVSKAAATPPRSS